MRHFTYRLFRATASLSSRAERRLTRAGKLALAALGAAGILGFDTNRTLGYRLDVIRPKTPDDYFTYIEDPSNHPGTGIEGWVDDQIAWAQPWGVELAAVRQPAAIWHGEEDRMKTPASAACVCIRRRSPSTAPPLNGLVGSTAITPTVGVAVLPSPAAGVDQHRAQ